MISFQKRSTSNVIKGLEIKHVTLNRRCIVLWLFVPYSLNIFYSQETDLAGENALECPLQYFVPYDLRYNPLVWYVLLVSKHDKQ